jgi:hypothetical protein
MTIIACIVAISQPRPAIVSADTLKAEGPLKWYRGNLHTHSHWSDGDDYLEMIALWYRDHNYQFLAFTDHNTLADRERWVEVEKTKGGKKAYDKLKARFPEGWVDERMIEDRLEVRLKKFDEVVGKVGQPGDFLMIQSEEISDKFGNLPIHMNAHNVRDAIPPMGGESPQDVIQRNVDALIAQQERTRQPMFVHINHPNFGWGLTAEDFMRVRGENFFEVYNGHPSVHNDGDELHSSTERIWDIINSMRLAELDLPLLYGLATDDGHSYHKIPSRSAEPGRGWVMVLAPELTTAALIENLERGRFYASSGVMLDEVTATPMSLTISVKPDADVTYRIDFIGTLKTFDRTSEPHRDPMGRKLHITRKYSSEIGKTLKSVNDAKATYDFSGDELYVRARVTSSRKHPNPSVIGEFERAWTQPVRPQ